MWGCLLKGSFCLADLHRQLASHVSPRLALTNTHPHIYTLLIHHSGSSVHWCLAVTPFLPLPPPPLCHLRVVGYERRLSESCAALLDDGYASPLSPLTLTSLRTDSRDRGKYNHGRSVGQSRGAYLVLWQWRLALSIRCLALALVAPHRRATRGGRHARHRADLGNLGLLGSAAQEWNHSHLSCWAEGREPKDTREGHKLEIWVCRWDHCINWKTETGAEVRADMLRSEESCPSPSTPLQ